MDEWEDPGEPQPWGTTNPYKKLQKDVAALVRARIITVAEARRALNLPPEPAAAQAPPRAPQRSTAARDGERVGRAMGKALGGLLSGPKRHHSSHGMARKAERWLGGKR